MFINHAKFSGKKVCLIGPAHTAPDDLKGVDLSRYDYVVRLNRAIEIPCVLENGAICEFNTLARSIDGNRAGHMAGHYTEARLEALEIEILIFVWGRWRYCLRMLRHVLEIYGYKRKPSLLIVNPNAVKEISKRLNGARPSTGFTVLYDLCKMSLSELHVAGFTFFQTPYIPNYNDKIEDQEAALKKIHAMTDNGKNWKHHAFRERDLAKVIFRECQAAGLKVTIGPGVDKALATDVF